MEELYFLSALVVIIIYYVNNILLLIENLLTYCFTESFTHSSSLFISSHINN